LRLRNDESPAIGSDCLLDDLAVVWGLGDDFAAAAAVPAAAAESLDFVLVVVNLFDVKLGWDMDLLSKVVVLDLVPFFFSFFGVAFVSLFASVDKAALVLILADFSPIRRLCLDGCCSRFEGCDFGRMLPSLLGVPSSFDVPCSEPPTPLAPFSLPPDISFSLAP